MTKIEDGGAAFPNAVQPDFQYAEAGMSLRDWFASQAISEAFKVAMNFNAKEASPCPFAARLAYDMADAMIAARSKDRSEP